MNGPFDRISSLPDDLLSHILSFVSTKEAVQTCILSKRWRNIWASVPVLNFLFHEFLVDDYDDEIEDDENWKFNRFVNGVFENRGKSRLDTLIYDGDFESSSYDPSFEWFDRAALLKPEVIKVSIYKPSLQWLNFPDSVFSFAVLENLELSFWTDGRTIVEPNSIALPSLKTMKLQYLSLNEVFARNLFLGCPLLESLNLETCDLFISEIASIVLKELTIDKCCQLEHMQS